MITHKEGTIRRCFKGIYMQDEPAKVINIDTNVVSVLIDEQTTNFIYNKQYNKWLIESHSEHSLLFGTEFVFN